MFGPQFSLSPSASSADGPYLPQVLRSRRYKKPRPLNGSMDHLADITATSAAVSETQMAPRSSTLPRRTRLSEFLADAENDQQKPAVKSGRQRRRSPKKKSGETEISGGHSSRCGTWRSRAERRLKRESRWCFSGTCEWIAEPC